MGSGDEYMEGVSYCQEEWTLRVKLEEKTRSFQEMPLGRSPHPNAASSSASSS
jgi:hypothetical protein